MLVTNARQTRLSLLDLAAEAVAGGVDGIYLRDVERHAHDVSMLVWQIRERVGADVALLLNGEPERAKSEGTGLHLRERDMAACEARAVLGPSILIGRSVHSAAGAAAAVGADYALAGHVYASTSKPDQPPLELNGFAAIVAAAPCPVLAIGGITPERVSEVVQAGAAGVAVIGAIAEADDPRAAAAALRTALDGALSRKVKESPMEVTARITNPSPAVEIVVNGKIATVPAASTVHDFLASKRMTDAMAIVERNGEIVPRAKYGVTTLQAGDRLEVVHAVGGG
jgi:thiamine biosynthesis protein ThiS